MPAKQKDNWAEYFNKLNKTLKNFEQRIEKLEDQVELISKESTAVSGEVETELTYQSSPMRSLGWVLVGLFAFLFFGNYLFGNIFYGLGLPYFITALLKFGSLIGGIVLILSNPKQGVRTR